MGQGRTGGVGWVGWGKVDRIEAAQGLRLFRWGDRERGMRRLLRRHWALAHVRDREDERGMTDNGVDVGKSDCNIIVLIYRLLNLLRDRFITT